MGLPPGGGAVAGGAGGPAKSRIRCEQAELDAATGPVFLQRELRLDGDAFDDVTTTLLFYRGLMVVPTTTSGDQEVIAMNDAERLHHAAVTRTPAEILARPSRIEFVKTTLPASELPLPIRKNMLRPFFGVDRSPWALRLADTDGQIIVTGSTEQVAFALRLTQLVDGSEPTVAREIAWTTSEPHDWPGGRMSPAKFMQLFAETLDANVVGTLGDDDLELGEPAQGTAADWFARATVALRSVDRAIVPVDPDHRVFLLRSLREERYREVGWRGCYEGTEQVAQSAAIVPVMTVFDLQHVDTVTAVNKLRGQMRGRSTLVLGSVTSSRMLFCGLRDEVAKMVDLLREADAAK